MNLIEQATRRLEELRRAGIQVPTAALEPSANGASVMRVVDAPAPEAPVAEPANDRSIGKSSREVAIDLDRLAAEGYLTPMLSNRVLAEQIRVIKQAVLKNVDDAGARGLRRNLVLVTSATAGEGKTFFSMNVAMSLAMEVDFHALLVDADVLRPSVLERYGIEPGPGLLDLAARPELDLSDVLLRTNVPKLSLLPAGKQSHKSPELLSSAYIDRLLTELSERYADRLVIFDAPPILVSSGTRHLASRVGQVIMVVEADSADSRAVTQAFEAVDACPLVSTVLNRSSLPDPGAYGYYET
ncbi:MAG: chromosome partitioning ATPase [Burkholderiales bacterium]|nr:chromosome partitioning ATPase [Burkholderiales bacterium]